MSDSRLARSHTNASNRAKEKDAYERKAVYKSVLDNPFTVPWPRIPTNVQNAIISQTIAMLDGVPAYHSLQGHSVKRKSLHEHRLRKKRKSTPVSTVQAVDASPIMETEDIISNNALPSTSAQPSADIPDILPYITFGINEVTKKLEALAQTLRQSRTKVPTETLGASDSAQESISQLVLVCTGDINPPILVGHLPSLVAACNSARSNPEAGSTWLVPLPAGSERVLSFAAGLRRVSVLMLNSAFPEFEALRQFLGTTAILRASWLLPATCDLPQTLVPTHIKQLQTTAPKDMKAVKEMRTKRRAEAKDRRKQKKAANPSVS
ncbi:hypothetical protein BDY19DRAFT_915995, partial [Irpex rosettiformis]